MFQEYEKRETLKKNRKPEFRVVLRAIFSNIIHLMPRSQQKRIFFE